MSRKKPKSNLITKGEVLLTMDMRDTLARVMAKAVYSKGRVKDAVEKGYPLDRWLTRAEARELFKSVRPLDEKAMSGCIERLGITYGVPYVHQYIVADNDVMHRLVDPSELRKGKPS